MVVITRFCPEQAFNAVLEYWSAGKSKSFSWNLNMFFHYSITPTNFRLMERLTSPY
jgi:hypothetical protein